MVGLEEADLAVVVVLRFDRVVGVFVMREERTAMGLENWWWCVDVVVWV